MGDLGKDIGSQLLGCDGALCGALDILCFQRRYLAGLQPVPNVALRHSDPAAEF